MDRRNHPIRQMLDAAASGAPPKRSELKELGESLATDGIPASWIASAVEKAAREIVEVRRDGANGAARRMAAAVTEEIVERLPEYEEPPVDPDEVRHEIRNIPRP
jgi:hypothetical protein